MAYRWIMCGLAIILGTCWLFGCGNSGDTMGDGGPDPDDPPPLKIGLVTPASGPLGSWGPIVGKAADLAVRELNATGGIRGREIKLVLGDSRAQGEVAEEVARKLVEEDGVEAFIGPMANGGAYCDVAEKISATEPIVQVSPMARRPCMLIAQPQNDRFAFSTEVPEIYQVEPTLEYMSEEGLCSTMVLIQQNKDLDYRDVERDIVRRQASANDIEVLDTLRLDIDSLEYQSTLMPLTDNPPDCFFTSHGFDRVDGALIEQWREIGGTAEIQWVSMALGTVENVEDHSSEGNREYFDGMLSPKNRVDLSGPTGQDFLNLYESTYGEEFGDNPNLSEGYDAAAALLLAMTAAGSTDPVDVRDALPQVTGGEGLPVRPGQLTEGVNSLREGTPVQYVGASGPVDLSPVDGSTPGKIMLRRYDAEAHEFELILIATANATR